MNNIRFLKRIQTATFQHEEVEISTVVPENGNLTEALAKLKAEAYNVLGVSEQTGNTVVNIVAANPDKVVKVEDKQTGAKAEINYGGVVGTDKLENGQDIPAVIKEPAKRRRTTATAVVAEEADKAATPSENAGGASTVVGSVDTKNVTSVQSTTPTTTTSVVGKGEIAYDAKVKEHRSRFATYLGNTYPTWKPDAKFGVADSPAKAEYAAKVTEFSKGLHGKAFEDMKGNMLDSFKAELESFFGHAK